MSTALAILLAPLAAAALVSGAGAYRDRDLRHTALFALIGLLGVHIALSPPPAPANLAAALELGAGPYLLVLALSLSTWWLAIAATRTLHERNGAEQAHWRDVETLRELAETLRNPSPTALPTIEALLEQGCRRYGFETGLLACVSQDDARILAVRSEDPDSVLALGPCPELVRTLALRCTLGDDVIAVEQASTGHWTTHPDHAPFGWESFLGVRVDEGPDGARVLCFASRSPRSERIVGTERLLMTVLGSWLSRGGARGGLEPDKPLVPALPTPIAIDLNAELGTLEPRLRRALAPGRPLQLELDVAAPTAGLEVGELERIVASMLLHASEAGPDDAPITLRTGSIQSPQPAASGFATISICTRGPALDSDALAALYERRIDPIHESGLRQLRLTRVLRLLRDLGGDLSMESEEHIGTTLTAFVPTRRAPE